MKLELEELEHLAVQMVPAKLVAEQLNTALGGFAKALVHTGTHNKHKKRLAQINPHTQSARLWAATTLSGGLSQM